MQHSTQARSAVAAFLGLAVAGGARAGDSVNAAQYRTEVERWRVERDERLRAPDGWLSLVGLTWLAPGTNRFGSASDNDVRLPAPAPAHAGAFVVEGRTVRL